MQGRRDEADRIAAIVRDTNPPARQLLLSEEMLDDRLAKLMVLGIRWKKDPIVQVRIELTRILPSASETCSIIRSKPSDNDHLGHERLHRGSGINGSSLRSTN